MNSLENTYEITNILLSESTLDDAMNKALSFLGKCLDASRAYVFENYENGFCCNTYEWCAEGIESKIENLQNLSLTDCGCDEIFKTCNVLFCPDAKSIPSNVRDYLKKNDAKAILLCAFNDNGKICGFIGFDDCMKSREDWTEKSEERCMLNVIANILSIYLVKERNFQKSDCEKKMILWEAGNAESIVRSMNIGTWVKEIEQGKNARLYPDSCMRELIGVSETDSPESCYKAWLDGISEEYRCLVSDMDADAMDHGMGEASYPWTYRDGRKIIVRCIESLDSKHDGLIRMRGFHRDITEISTVKKNLEQNISFINGIGRIFLMFSRIDFKNNSLNIMKTGSFETSCDGNATLDLRKSLMQWGENDIPEACRKQFESLWNADKLQSRLRDTDVISEEIKTIRSGWINIQVVVLSRDEYGNALECACLGHVIDVKKRHALESNLNLMAFAKLYYVVFSIDLKNDTYSVLSMPEYLGDVSSHAKKAQEALYSWVDNILLPEYRDEVRSFVNLSTLDERMKRNEICKIEYRNYENLWTEGSFVPVDYDEDGSLSHVIYAARIVEEQKKIEFEAKVAQKRELELLESLSKIYTTMHIIDIRTDEHEEIWANSTIHNLVGVKGSVKKSLADVVKYYCAEEHKERLTNFFDVSTLARRINDNDGYCVCEEYMTEKYRWVRSTFITKEKDENGNGFKFLYVTQDIDEKKKRELMDKEALKSACEAAERASNAKTMFLSNMSHDIRTPMNAIMGFATIAESRIDDRNRGLECLKKILVSSEHLQELINGILDMSRIESGKTVLDLQKTSLFSVVNDVIPLIQPQAQAKNILLKVDVGCGRDDWIIADSLRLRQILVNVLGNSVKFTNDGGNVSLLVRHFPSSRKNFMSYEIAISDTGIGMSEEFQKKVFEPFERERTSTQSGSSGTGLGLAISKSFVDMMGGTIRVESKPGKGSCFYINIDFELHEDAREFNLDSIPDDKEPASCEKSIFSCRQDDLVQKFKGKRILLVEDNEFNMEIAVDILEFHGLLVDCSHDGMDACEKLLKSDRNYYSMVLMDIQMPVMNGYEATRKIRHMERDDVRNIPIIAMTANAFKDDVQASLDAGMNDHISKPLDFKNVISAIGKFIL